MAELKTSLERLEMLTAQLNSESDHVNALISAVEEKIGRANLGLSLWLEFGGSPVLVGDVTPAEPVYAEQLGYGKVGDTWRLCVRTVSVDYKVLEDEPYVDVRPIGDPRPLLEAGRIVRVEACGHLTLLVDTLAAKVERLLQGIEAAKNSAKQ